MKRMSKPLLTVIAASVFAGLAGTASAQAPAPDQLVDALEGVFGKQPGARRSGAKGVCATGFFVGTPEGRGLSTAAVFKGAEIPTIVRFSVGGGNPKAPDKLKSVRGLALKINGPGKESWEMANISAPVFFVNSPANFVKFFEARRPVPGTNAPDPAKVKAFNDAHPDAKPQIAYLASAPVPASYGAVNYWGNNAFIFTGPDNKKRAGKWVFEPARGVEGLTDEQLKTMPNDFLVDELKARLAKGNVAFNFNVQIAEPGDVINDATVPLPAGRKVVNAGRLVIEKLDLTGASCDKLTFNPLVLPKGVAPSDDPVLMARPGAYAVSLGRRLQK